ncbi:MAG: protein kinase [Myxococcales bacterium]|nr:protein kinase [Myxococcales bacterium]
MIDPSAHEPRPERVAGHYLVQERLGAGGMAVVDRVVDERTGEELALKRLTRSGQVVEALFEREYQILSELAHPRIVRVHEYGLDDAGKYYTMELLKGEELLGRLPMPWQNVCVVLRDVPSALALVHSRRLLHRDVTARNVHLGPDGRAKLMDFGSVVNMGLVEGVVGTPPHIAPEAFLEQPLDARTDLYSLGALAYQALTGHHAYPAHHTGQLRAVWHRPLRPPAQLVEAIPEDLNRLVLSLLSLDRLARPASAADVMERLTSIAGLPLDESPAVARCYLTTPTLTGRDSELVRVRQALLRAVRGRGGAIAYVGTDGVGRSRMLAACRLEAKLLGAASIHVTGSSEHPFATFRQLLTATLDQWPELNRQATELQLLQSMLAGTHPQPATLEPERVVEAFLELLQAAARTGCLVVTIDDLHHCDPESTFVFVHLARRAHGMALLVGAAGDTSIRSGSMEQLFVREARLEHLELLDLDQTHTLLGSLFGDAQHLKLATDWAYGVSKGNPGRIVQLAQHLLDTGVARYEKGCWTLPRDFKRLPLPRSIAETLAVQLDRLRSDAKTIATGLALCLENYPLPAQYQGLLLTESHESIEQRLATRRALDELVALEILRSRDGPARFAHAVVREALVDRLQPAARRALHARLAAAFRQDENAGQLVVAYHLAESGDESTALELALEYLKTSGDKRDNVNRDFALEAMLLERLLGSRGASAAPGLLRFRSL